MLSNQLKAYKKTSCKKQWLILLTFCLATICTTNTGAQAAPRAVDVFSINSATQSNPKAGAGANNSILQNNTDRTPIVIWFEKFDSIREKYHPSERDKVILTRPLTQDAGRVQQWVNTASKVSKDYLTVGKSIRSLTVPPGMSDVKEYRDLVADWFQDSANIYIDLIRPRPPAKTIEDLQEELDAVKKRAEGLANTIANLKNMDREIREAHKVPISVEDDAVQKFARGK
jgi:hypothetical protein